MSVKTNAMRILDKEKVPYSTHSYDCGDGVIDGVSVASKIGVPQERVFKTLVTQGASREYYVFVIPVAAELNLKAAAKAVGEKSVEMIKVADITKVTGYVRGGCSPLGMKKAYKTVVDASAEVFEAIVFSAGKLGHQIETSPGELLRIIQGTYGSITMES